MASVLETEAAEARRKLVREAARLHFGEGWPLVEALIAEAKREVRQETIQQVQGLLARLERLENGRR